MTDRPNPHPTPGAEPGPSSENRPPRKHVKVRAWHILLLTAAVITCLLLARWQWHRYQSGTGTFQNLGYAMQWPFFAAFFVYAYRMGIKMENEKIDAENAGSTMEDLYEADLKKYGGAPGADAADASAAPDEAAGPRNPSTAKGPPTKIDEDFLPQRPTIDVEEYNALVTPRRQRIADTDHPEDRKANPNP